jgi:hypothetical protein
VCAKPEQIMPRTIQSWLLTALVLTIAPALVRAAGSLNDLTLKLQVRSELVTWYNQIARPGDVAVFPDSPLTGLGSISAGRKLVLYTSAATAEQAVPLIAGQIDMIGYDIEHWPQTPPDEQADPVAALKRMRALADKYGLKLGVGPDRSFGAQFGAQFAPYVDQYTLQLQNLQSDAVAMNAYALPLIAQLRQAKSTIGIDVQLSTDAGSDGLIQLADAIKSQIDGLGILYTPQTENILQDFVAKLRAGPPTIVAAPVSQTVAAGQTATFSVGANSTPAPTFQWMRNGTPLSGATSATLTLGNVQPADTGLYAVVIANPTGTTTSAAAILGVTTTSKVIGAGEEIQHDVFVAANGNTFDQVLLEGTAEAVTADYALKQITRTSFIDLTDDIVQVELSGPGTLSLVLDTPTGPALPVNYYQNVTYMKGHAGLVITGATKDTNVSVFSVGRMTAVNQTLFKDNVTYDGVADIAFIAIASTDGQFGGVRTADANYFAAKGLTGIYAPAVTFTGPVYAGDINASGTASPVLLFGSAGDVRITGGALLQANGQPVQVSGLTQLKFTDGTTSGGSSLPAQLIQGRLTQNGQDVTSQLATTTGSIAAKKFHPGHYMMLNIGSTSAQQRTLIAQNATDPNIVGFQICYTWAQLEPDKGNYTGIDATIASDLVYVAQLGKQLVVQLQYKSKTLGDFPVDLQVAPGAFVQGSDGYYIPNLWDSSAGIRSRFVALLQQIAVKCDAHPNLEIVNLAESATVDAATTLGGTYTAQGWVDALQAIAQAAGTAFKTTTFEEYINHISGDDSLVGAVCANAINAGCIFGGPDIDPSRNNIPAYAYYAQYAATAHLASAVQPMDYGLTGAFWFDSDHSQTTEHLFAFSTSPRLHLSYIYWLNNFTDANWRNAKATIDAHPWPWY